MVSSGVVVVSPRLKFNGFLFNGKIAHKQPVRIVLTPFNIILTVQGKSAISWPYSDIRWAAVTPPFHIERDISFPVENLEILVVDDPDFYENIHGIELPINKYNTLFCYIEYLKNRDFKNESELNHFLNRKGIDLEFINKLYIQNGETSFLMLFFWKND